jgi:hypothetical protein
MRPLSGFPPLMMIRSMAWRLLTRSRRLRKQGAKDEKSYASLLT